MRFLLPTLVAVVVVFGSCSASAAPSWKGLLQREVAGLGLAADVTATIEESLFQKICATVVPLINQYAQGLVIPGQSGSHFSYSNVVIQQFDIGSMAITMSAPSALQVALNDISFSIPNTNFDVWDRIIVKISCSGIFWASMTGTSIVIDLTVSQMGGKLVFTNAQSSVQWGSLNVGHDFPNFFCKLGNDIIQLFVGNLNSLIEKTVEQDMPAKIGPMMSNALNAAMQRLPLDIVSEPQVTDASISVTVDLLNGAGAGIVAKKGPQRRAQVGMLAPRDLELEIASSALDNLLIYAQQRGLLNMNVTDPTLNTSAIMSIFPTVYSLCPGCPFAVEVNLAQAPVVTLGNETIATAVAQSILGMNIVAHNGTVIPFVDLWVNATGSASGISVRSSNAIYFQLTLGDVSLGLKDSAIGPIDVSLLSEVVNVALGLVVTKFNANFSGVPLPAAAQQVEVGVLPASLSVAFNLQL